MTTKEKKQKAMKLIRQIDDIYAVADKQNREINDEENARLDKLLKQIEALDI